jgi:hypothetical protein
MAEIIYKEESYSIIGACFEVYKEMGCCPASPESGTSRRLGYHEPNRRQVP